MNPIGNPFRAATRALRSRLARRRSPRPERAASLPVPADLGAPLRAFRAAALWGLALLVATADGAAFAESYRGLFEWAQHHDLSGFWAAAFPLQVDLFIVAGELVLFVATADRWGWRERLGAWAVAGLGLAVSVAGNIGHVAAHDLQSRGTAAVPPVAAFGALWLGLGVLKRILRHRQAVTTASAQSAQATTGRDDLADAVGELRDAVRALAGRPDGELPADAEHAAVIAMRATRAAGNPLSARQLEVRFGLTRTQAARVREAAEGKAVNNHQAAAGEVLAGA